MWKRAPRKFCSDDGVAKFAGIVPVVPLRPRRISQAAGNKECESLVGFAKSVKRFAQTPVDSDARLGLPQSAGSQHDKVAVARLVAGRTSANLIHLMDAFLLVTNHRSGKQSLSPTNGLFAGLRGRLVFIVSTYPARRVGRACVLRLSQRLFGGYYVRFADIESCRQNELTNVSTRFIL